MAQKYVCPACQQELKGRVCGDPDCGCDLDVLFKDVRFDPERLNEILRASGAFYSTGTESVVLPRSQGIPPIECSMVRQGHGLEPLQWWFITEQGYPRSKFSPHYLQAYLSIFGAQRLLLPQVDYFGDRPQLFLIDGKLAWPNPSSVTSRLISEGRFYYTGPELSPKRTGLFDEFMATIKCRDDGSRAIFKTWIVGALLQALYPPGGSPMLVLAATNNGTGKSATTRVVGSMLGGLMQVHWPDISSSSEGFARRLMDPRCRTVVFDNMAPSPGEEMNNAPGMASMITNPEISVKTLFVTRGYTVVPNRYLFMATANRPIFSCELFSRSAVVTMDSAAPSFDKWEETWQGQRVELLEDLMAEVLENWAKGPFKVQHMPRNYRFLDWYHAVARATQSEPRLYPDSNVLTPPLDYALRVAFKSNPDGEMTVSQVLETLNTLPNRSVREIMAQKHWDLEAITEELALYNSDYAVFDRGDDWCVRLKVPTLQNANG